MELQGIRSRRLRKRDGGADGSDAERNSPAPDIEAPPQHSESPAPEDRQTNQPIPENEEKADETKKVSSSLALPLKVLEPIRSDPTLQMRTRHKKMERLVAERMPEIHAIGRIVSGRNIIREGSDGATCRWKIDSGKGWQHIAGETFGQTQVAYCRHDIDESVVFDHPLDVHYAEAGMQGWGSPRIALQVYRLDWHGRRILCGYGFVHIPITSGYHKLEVDLWQPLGNLEQEMDSYFLGRVPALVTHEPIYETSWRERCRLVTAYAGKVFIELFVVTRFLQSQGIDTA